jgi:DNA-binding MarR family transcriptional regulator
MGVREGLDYDHHSRTSRWRPDIRMSYCNSGPPVVAYIVEKLTGQKFEDFVQQNLFQPIGMSRISQVKQSSSPRPTVYLLKHVQSELGSAIEEALAPTDLMASQVAVLSALSSLPGLSNADLACVAFVTPQSMVPLLTTLKTRGLVVRHAPPSGARAMPAKLTAKGTEHLKIGRAAVKKVEDRMLEGLTTEDQLRLRELLEQCLASLRPGDSV